VGKKGATGEREKDQGIRFGGCVRQDVGPDDIAQHSVPAAILGGQHELLEIDASSLLLAPPCGGPSADRGAKNEACLSCHRPRAATSGGHCAKQPD
jgi:hypothetical protein